MYPHLSTDTLGPSLTQSGPLLHQPPKQLGSRQAEVSSSVAKSTTAPAGFGIHRVGQGG